MSSEANKDHDSNVSVTEVLERIAAAEALLAEAKAMLQGNAAQPVSAAKTPPVVVRRADGEFDELLLSRYAPPGPDEDFRSAVCGLFHLVLDAPTDRDHLGEALRRLMHSESVNGPRSLESLLRFGWVRFSKYSQQYLASATEPASFHVLRTEPADSSETDELKAFLEAKGRGPVPITLRRDAAFEKAWRIHAFSL